MKEYFSCVDSKKILYTFVDFLVFPAKSSVFHICLNANFTAFLKCVVLFIKRSKARKVLNKRNPCRKSKTSFK